jgi:L-ascorbate metabolism protein UlaG (beta-lactamase superfamily)
VNAVAYLGHATVLMELDGAKLLTDPLLRRRVTHLRRADDPRMEGLRDVDAVLISHAHHDHLHLRSLRLLDRSTRIVVPKGVGWLVKLGRFRSIEEVDEGDTVEIGSLRVRATHAEHSGTRQPGWLQAPALGYAIEGSQRIYFAGDTDLFEGMAGLVPNLDVALLPIWGWGPSLGPGHMSPREAAEAAHMLQATVAIPMHWGTFFPLHTALRGKPAFIDRPLTEFEAEMEALAPTTEVRALRPGEETIV